MNCLDVFLTPQVLKALFSSESILSAVSEADAEYWDPDEDSELEDSWAQVFEEAPSLVELAAESGWERAAIAAENW